MARHGFYDLPLAIVGMACRLPGADSLDEYWQLVREGKSGLVELPPERLDGTLYYHPEKGRLGKSYCKMGGIVPERPFDRDLLPVSEQLLAAADPSHRILLEVVAQAFRHAGWDPRTWVGRTAGVFIGHARGSLLAGDLLYATHVEGMARSLEHDVATFARLPGERRAAIVHDLVQDVRAKKPHRRPGGAPHVACHDVAALVSEAFGLTGPFMAVDAACASSLYALAAAAGALHDGRIEMAIVGGASFSSWQSLVLFSHAQALSANLSCPFDERADGFISADGYAAVLVKTLPRARTDGDAIFGVVRGIGISNDGHGRSLWAPRREGQIQAIRRAYVPGQPPARLQYIEAHGTSTQLGDATELEALTAALGEHVPRDARIPIASVKANIGHTRETAGLAGLIKTLLAMQCGVVPPAANFEIPNRQIPWDEIPFFVPTRETAWPVHEEDGLRHAAVDAFGIGGMNVHVVVEAAPAGKRASGFVPALAVPDADGLRSPRHQDDAVAVIGMGAIFPGARTVAAYGDLLASGRTAIGRVPPDRWNAEIFHDPGAVRPWRSPTVLGGFIHEYTYDWRKHKIPPKQVETGDPLQFMLLDAADQALENAGYAGKPFERSRTGVVVGTMFGGDFNVDLNLVLRLPEFERDLAAALWRQAIPEEDVREIVARFREAFLHRRPMIYDETGSYSSSTLASRIARTLDLLGGAFAVDAGEASSFAALDVAVDLLRSGACDLVLCAGAQRSMDIWYYEALAMRGLIGPTPVRAAVDGAGGEDGGPEVVPGEGVGMLLLKRLSDARRDADPVVAVIRGIGSAAAGSPESNPRDAARSALARAALATGEVSAVEAAAGPGEAHTQIGHTLGASGMASLLKLLLALRHERADGRVGNVGAVAFRGLAYHVVVEAGPPAAVETSGGREDWRIIRLGAPTVGGLMVRLGGSVDRAEGLYAHAGASRFGADDVARLAIVAPSPDALGKKIRLAAAQLTQPGARPILEEQGIFWRPHSPTSPRLALLFPGQGSQYVGMLRALTRESPAARVMVDEADDTMRRLGFPSFSEIAWAEDVPLGRDVWRTQVAVLLGDLIVYAALRALGVRPDVISGHSYGEYAALVASGGWTLEEAIRVTRARSDLIESSPRTTGVMLSTTAPPEVVEGLAAGIRGTVVVANHNAPDQTVVGGEREAVTMLGAGLAEEGFETQLLPVPRPFHTPLLSEVQEPLRQVLREARILPPVVPLLSSVTNRYAADPEDIRDNLVRQLTEPVRYVGLIERLARDGVTAFVEVGPRQVLTRLHRRILRDSDALVVAGDNPKRPGISQLWHVRAALECAGIPLRDRAPQDAPARISAAAGVRGTIVHFDATLRRRERMRSLAAAPAAVPVEAAATAVHASPAAAEPVAAAPDEPTAFLVNFVCEQTGYPREVVDLDADMEADLGIDSIKKAQLFGELRERFRFQFSSTDRVALDDFPTLRHVLEFLRRAGVGTQGRDAGRPAARPTPAASAGGSPSGDGAAALPGEALNLVRCTGTPQEMGRQHAQIQAPGIRHTLKELKGLLLRQRGEAELVAFLETLMRQAERHFDPDALEELRGMAAALDIPPSFLVAFNVGLYHEYAAGCTQFAITGRRNGADGMLHGVNEDCPLALLLPDALSRVVQLRHPASGIPHVLFGAAGQVGGLNGMNAQGLAVTSTMLLDRRRRHEVQPGIIQPVLVKTILQYAAEVETAVEIARGAKRMGAWSLCISHHPTDRLVFLEYDAESLEVRWDQDIVMTTNHCLVHPPQEAVPEHSLHRLRRLQDLLGNDQAGFTLTQAQAALRDRYDLDRRRETPHPTMNTIQRVDNQISLVMHPAAGHIWVAAGPQSREAVNGYHKLDVRQVLTADAPAPVSLPDGETSSGTAGRVMSRFVLRVGEAPLPPGSGQVPRFHGPVLILGENPTTQALATRLEEMGAAVRRLPPSDGIEETLAALDQLWSVQPLPHLFLLTAWDEDASAGLEQAAWRRRRGRGILLPYFLCQRWTRLVAAAGLLEKSSLVAVTALGGDFGFSGKVSAVEGGGLAGLLKAIRREFKMLVKVIDTAPEEPPGSVTTAIFRELSAATPEVEVGYVRGQRRLVRAVPRPAARGARREIPRGETWVVTGGARGVTAVVARELGRRFGLNLHLIGTSPAPPPGAPWWSGMDAETLKARVVGEARRAGRDPVPAWQEVQKAIEIDRTLRALAEDGVRATYHSCDVADRRALADVLGQIRRSAGPIRGIIHGAGVESACRFERKQRDRVEATIAAKVDGAAALMALTCEDPLRYFVGFGSVSGRFGGLGQTDYALASDLLCKLIQRFREERPECASVAIHWPAWDEVGMAVRPESRVALELGQQRLMPPREGIAHLIEELEAGAPEGEVLILDRPGLLDLDGIMPAEGQEPAYRERYAVMSARPLIDGMRELRGSGSLLAEIRFDPVADPFLAQHRFQGRPLLPAVVGIEALAEAASVLDPGQPSVGLRNVEILNGLRFYDNRAKLLDVRAVRAGDGVDCALSGSFHSRQGKLVDPQRIYIRGRVEPVEAPRALNVFPPGLADQWNDMTYVDAQRAVAEGLVFHGPALRCLRRVALDGEGGWGEVVAPPPGELGGDRQGDWIIPAACLDACLVVCGVFARQSLGLRQLPHAFGSLRFGRPARTAEVCTVRVDYRGRRNEHTSFDFVLLGEDGEVILSAEDHAGVVLAGS